MNSLLNRQVLVLNQNYEPLSVCNARRAILLIFKGKAEIVEQDGYMIHSISQAFPLPSVVRLVYYVRVPYKKIVLSKRNIVKRDGGRCQYCGTTRGPMTVDHVVPRSFGGEDTWENLVCACIKCNNQKADRTLEQSGMNLLRRPQRPSNIMFIKHLLDGSEQKWRPYLFM